MNSKPRKVIYLISRLALVMTAVFSGVNILFSMLGIDRLMPMALSMTGYLAKFGIRKTAETGSPFFSIYCAAMAGVVCVVFALCALLAAKNRGWLVAAVVMFLVDCAGITILIAANGYRDGYWFEIAGHAAMLLALLVGLCSMPRREKENAQ